MTAGLILGGCANVYAPAVRPADGESPAVLPKGSESFGIAMGTFDWNQDNGTYGQHFVQFGITRGMGSGTDLRAVATTSLPARDSVANPEIALAIRLKWNPEPVTRFLAFTAGGGMGSGWTHSSYTFESGVLLGFENPYAVPYLDQRGSFNGSLTPRLGHRARNTFSSQTIVGARVALRPGHVRTPWLRAEAGRSDYRYGDVGFDNLFYRAQFDMPIRNVFPEAGDTR